MKRIRITKISASNTKNNSLPNFFEKKSINLASKNPLHKSGYNSALKTKSRTLKQYILIIRIKLDALEVLDYGKLDKAVMKARKQYMENPTTKKVKNIAKVRLFLAIISSLELHLQPEFIQ